MNKKEGLRILNRVDSGTKIFCLETGVTLHGALVSEPKNEKLKNKTKQKINETHMNLQQGNTSI